MDHLVDAAHGLDQAIGFAHVTEEVTRAGGVELLGHLVLLDFVAGADDDLLRQFFWIAVFKTICFLPRNVLNKTLVYVYIANILFTIACFDIQIPVTVKNVSRKPLRSFSFFVT